MKSSSLRSYKDWLSKALPQQIDFVDTIYDMCEKNYENGGDVVVECYGPEEILERFKTLDECKELCGLIVEQAANARCGEETDPELKRLDAFKNWKS